MRMLLAALICALMSAQLMAADKPAAKPKAKPASKSNRFEMVQNGKRMSAEDFDAWMKARGIRIAKGPQALKPAKKKKR